jgi:DNA polymerase-3 subunit beta
MVGTDGNRLSWAQGPFTGTLSIGRRMLLPRKPLAEVRKMIDGLSGPVEIGFGERAVVMRFEGVTVHMRLLEAEFPNYKEVLPTNFKRRVVVDRDVFMEGLRRVSIFATDGSHSVRFAFTTDGLVLTARKLDAGDAREEVAIDFSGDPITMGFNARFIQDVLAALKSTRVTLELGDTLSPCILKPMDEDNALFVVMPVRLD